jgi:hypothetical protein
MQVTIRSSVNKTMRERIPEIIEHTHAWLKTKYPAVDFDGVDLIFTAGARGSKYFNNKNGSGKYTRPAAQISIWYDIILYEMKSLKLKRYKLYVGNEINTACAIVHELTHHAQHVEGRGSGELETTRNEVEYLQAFHPDIYEKLTQ